MPRSLISCYERIMRNLDLLAEAYGGKRGECHRLAGELHSRLRSDGSRTCSDRACTSS